MIAYLTEAIEVPRWLALLVAPGAFWMAWQFMDRGKE
jgi:hypothetical protein